MPWRQRNASQKAMNRHGPGFVGRGQFKRKRKTMSKIDLVAWCSEFGPKGNGSALLWSNGRMEVTNLYMSISPNLWYEWPSMKTTNRYGYFVCREICFGLLDDLEKSKEEILKLWDSMEGERKRKAKTFWQRIFCI